MNKPIIKTWVILTMSLILIGITAAPAAAETAWADNVVSYDSCWSSPDNIVGVDDDVYAVGIDDGCAIVVDMDRSYSNGTIYVNRHYSAGPVDGDIGIWVYVSSDASTWTMVGIDVHIMGEQPTSDSDFIATFSQSTEYVKIVAVCQGPECGSISTYLDSVRIVGAGPPDILVGCDTAVELLVYDTAGGFSSVGEVANLSNNIMGLAGGDFNDDGNTDFLVSEYVSTYSGNIWLFIGDGGGNFTSSGIVASLDQGPRDITADDFDGDGDIDFLVAAYNIEMYLNNGTGGFTYGGRVVTTHCAWHVTSADFDGDGDIDLIESDMYGTKLYRNDGTGSFTGGSTVSYIPYAGLTSGDFDGDGDADVLVSNSYYINDGTGSFTLSGTVCDDTLWSLTSNDFNGDGDIDFAASDLNVDMYENNGTGGFTRVGRILTNDYWATPLACGSFAPTVEPIHPDLVPVNISPSSLFVNITNTVYATVANNGNKDAGEFNVCFFVEGCVVDTATVFSLGTENSTTVSFEWLPDSIGDYNISVEADTDNVVWEMNETDNGLIESIPVVQGYPDLVPVDMIVEDEIFVNLPTTVSAVIENNNTATAHADSFNVSLLADGAPVDVKPITSLLLGDTVMVEFNWTPEHIGSCTLTIVADCDNIINETNETNNELPEIVDIAQGYADLISAEIITPLIFANESNTISAVIENNGTADAGSFNVSLLANGIPVDEVFVTSLNVGSNSTVNLEWMPELTGNYTLTLIADCDDVINETNETNNSQSTIVTVLPPLPDLTVADINAYHYTSSGYAFFNLTNFISITIDNSKLGAGAFNVSLYIDDEFIDKKAVPGLDTGSQTDVVFDWLPVGKDCMKGGSPKGYTIEAFVDSNYDVGESNESNNNDSSTTTVYWNGYSADEPLDNAAHGIIQGGIYYTFGDSRYLSGSAGETNPGMVWDAHYNITLPTGAKVKLAKLNAYYCWGTHHIMVNLTIPNGTTYHDIPIEKSYADRKCAPGFNCLWGNDVYNLTPYINESGVYTLTRKFLENNVACPAGPGIVVVYEDDSMPLVEYWINEGSDVLIGGRRGDGGYLSLEECITNSTFSGSINVSAVTNTTLAVVSGWTGYTSEPTVLYFNGIELGRGLYSRIGDISLGGIRMTGSGGPQVAVSLIDVRDYLDACDNFAGQGDNGDCMMPSNAFLLVEYGNDTILPNVTDHSPEGDEIWVGSPMTVTFSEAMNRTSAEDAFTIVPTVDGTFEWYVKTMTFLPVENLAYNTTYNITIGTGAMDRAGNNLESQHSWEFTTEAFADTSLPNVTTHSPIGGNVSVYNKISVTFSEDMNHTSVEDAILIVPAVSGTITWNETTITFSPDILEYNTTYNVTITASATDLTGNSLDGNNNGVPDGSPADDYVWQFITEEQEFKSWDFDGFPLTTKSHGTVNGGVFISYGDNDRMQNAKVAPYVTNFSVPNGTPVWAKLYLHLWGGNPYNCGTVNVTFNSHDFETVVIEGKQTSDSHILGSGCGTWWLFFNVTDLITPGDINRAQASVTSESLDGRIARMVLVEAHEGGDNPQNVMYWVNDGHMNLHYNSSEYPWCLDSTKAWFNGTVPSGVTQANLTGIWLTGSYNEPDYFYFSPPDAPDAPNGSNLNWDIGNYSDYQFGAYDLWTGKMSYHDVAMGGGYFTNYFDMHSNTTTNTSTITNILKDDNNYAIFWRGHDDNDDGWIYGAFGGDPTTYEGEGYVHPVLAALVLNFEDEDITPPYTDGYDPAPGDVNVPMDTNITVHVKDSSAGVNVGSIEMKVNNVSVIPDISGTSADYELIYDPLVNFSYEEVVNVSIDACDLDDNCMQYVWEFTIESEQTVECGDVDGENGVTIGDGIQVAMYTIYGPEQYPLTYPWAADVDCENGITIGDGIQIAMSTIYGTDQYPLECC